MNAEIFNDNPQENKSHHGFSLAHVAHKDAFKPDILCIKGLPYEALPPNHTDSNLTIQFIKFKYGNDRFS